MPPILVLGFAAALAVATSSSSATPGAERRQEAARGAEQGNAGEKPSAPARVDPEAGAAKRGLICTLRIIRADPSIDRGIVLAVERPVDPGMVVPSRCAAE